MKLTDREWRLFKADEFFEECKVKNKYSKIQLSEKNRIPVYSSQVENGGILGYADGEADFKYDGCLYILFGDHTKEFHIVDYDFCVADNVKVLSSKIDRKCALWFFLICWKKSIPNLGYARHWRAAKRSYVMLPVNEYEEPDYAFMEKYIKELLLKKYLRYLEKAR